MTRGPGSLGDLSDEELVLRIQAGDQGALPLLFDRYLGTLTVHARRKLPDRLRRRVSVSDLLQEARITALRRSADFEHRGPGSVRNWLLKIVEFKVRDALEKHAGAARRAVNREVSRGGRPDTAQFMGHAPSPSQMAAAGELRDLADQALATLPEHYRDVLRLARVERLSLREIAEKTDRSREAVKKLCARALSQFTRAFERLRGDSHG